MLLNNFVTTEFLSSFTGTLFVVELIVFITKNISIIKKIKTRFYTFILAISHTILMGFVTKVEMSTLIYYYSAFINSLIITVILCGGYDMIIDKMKSVTNMYNKDVGNSSKKVINTLVNSTNKSNGQDE